MKISLIIPCYNEVTNIQKGVLDRVGNYTKDKNVFEEVIIINDGSSDETAAIIQEKYIPLFSKMKLVTIAHQGKALAVIEGFKQAKGSHIIFTDFDLSIPLEETNKFIKEFDAGVDLVIGSRAHKREGAPFTRKLQSEGFVFIRDLIIGLNGLVDTQCGFKGFRKNVATKIISHMKVFTKDRVVSGPSVSAGFDIEILYLAQKMGFTIKEIPVAWRHAESKSVNFITDSIETIKDILRIKWYDMKGLYKIEELDNS